MVTLVRLIDIFRRYPWHSAAETTINFIQIYSSRRQMTSIETDGQLDR